MDSTSTQDPSESSSPAQVPADDFPLTTEQMETSTLMALPLGPDGAPVVVDLAPGSTLLDLNALDPALLPGLPRADNQYNQDYTEYANQVHNRDHGSFHVANPHEEWACRNYGPSRYWFYRAWFHHKTIRWDHDDVPYYKSTPGYFLGPHPYSTWADQHLRVWGTRGWQLVVGAIQSLPIWEACENYENAILAEEQGLAEENRLAAQSSAPAAHPRGLERQAVDNIEHTRVEYLLENLLQDFSQLDVSQSPGLRHLPAPQQQQLIQGLKYTLTSYQDEFSQALNQQEPLPNSDLPTDTPSAPSGHELPITPAATGTDVPVPDSGSMSLTSSSTSPENTLAPPFPPSAGTQD